MAAVSGLVIYVMEKRFHASHSKVSKFGRFLGSGTYDLIGKRRIETEIGKILIRRVFVPGT